MDGLKPTMRVSYRGTLDNEVPYGSAGTLKLIDNKNQLAEVQFDGKDYIKSAHKDNVVPE